VQVVDLNCKEEERPRWDGRASNPVGGAKRRRVGSTPALLRPIIIDLNVR